MAATFAHNVRCRNPVTRSKLETALIVAAKSMCRYEGTKYEVESIRIFERIEAAHTELLIRERTRARALTLLSCIDL